MLVGHATGGEGPAQERTVRVEGRKKIQPQPPHRWASEQHRRDAEATWRQAAVEKRPADPEGPGTEDGEAQRARLAQREVRDTMEQSLLLGIRFIMPGCMYVQKVQNKIFHVDFEDLARERSSVFELGLLLDSRFTLEGLRRLDTFCRRISGYTSPHAKVIARVSAATDCALQASTGRAREERIAAERAECDARCAPDCCYKQAKKAKRALEQKLAKQKMQREQQREQYEKKKARRREQARQKKAAAEAGSGDTLTGPSGASGASPSGFSTRKVAHLTTMARYARLAGDRDTIDLISDEE